MIERMQDSLFTRFVKDFKSFSYGLSAEKETFYIDLFSTAYSMLAKKSAKDKEMYQDMLFDDVVKFLVLVLQMNEEKHAGKRFVA